MDTEKIGSFIAARRKARGITQQQLADEIGLTNKAISKWETGQGMPDITLLPLLAEILGVKVDELLKGELLENKLESSAESKFAVHKSVYWFRVAASLSTFFAIIGDVVPFFMMKETTVVASLLFGCWFELCSLAVFVIFYYRMKEEVVRYNKNSFLTINSLKIRNQFLGFLLWLWLIAPSGLIVCLVFKLFSWENPVLQLILTLVVTITAGLLYWVKMINTGQVSNKNKGEKA